MPTYKSKCRSKGRFVVQNPLNTASYWAIRLNFMSFFNSCSNEGNTSFHPTQVWSTPALLSYVQVKAFCIQYCNFNDLNSMKGGSKTAHSGTW